jgi:HK97 family phage major capsid protein/HK97 family phage prohead protease
MIMSSKSIVKQKLDRDFTLEKRSIDKELRTVEIAFSSEEPYERYFGEEVLSHDPQSLRLGRLESGAAVLVNHDPGDQVGVVESARVDGDRRGRAVIRFSQSDRGREIFQDVQDGIRSLVSVGYRIHKYDVTERKGQPDLVKVTDWEPYELSIVSIPADPSVGVGRSDEVPQDFVKEQVTTPKLASEALADVKNTPKKEIKMTEENVVEAPKFCEKSERKRIRTEESQRVDSIRSIADKYGLDELSREAVSEGWDVSKFNTKALEAVGERNSKSRENERQEAKVDLSKPEMEKFSFIKLMDALSNPNDRSAQKRAGFELEVCADAESQMPSDFNARGVFIPANIFERDLSAGTATDGKELVGTSLLSGSYIDVLRKNMVALQAGVTMLPGLVGNVDIPRQTAGASSVWITAEDGDATESEPQFDTVSLTPKDLAAYTEVTRRLTQQSTPAIEALVRNDLFQAIAQGLDNAVYYGSGSAGQPRGIDGATGVNDPTFAVATAPTYAEIVTQMKTVMLANAASNLTYIGSPDFWESMITTAKQASGVEGNFISNGDTILGRQLLISSQLAADDFVLGDFSQVLLGEWGGIELNVDPYTHSLKGKTRYVIFKTADIAIRRPQAFSFHNAV